MESDLRAAEVFYFTSSTPQLLNSFSSFTSSTPSSSLAIVRYRFAPDCTWRSLSRLRIHYGLVIAAARGLRGGSGLLQRSFEVQALGNQLAGGTGTELHALDVPRH